MSELDLLRSLGDQIVPPPLDTLRETARRRTRRTTTATVVSAAAAVAVVAGTTVLTATDDASKPRPIGPPDVVTTRPLTYAEGTTIRYGDQTVTAPDVVVELDVTDDGVVVRTEDGGIWFTDGSDLDQVGTLGDPGPAHEVMDYPYASTGGFVVSGNTGSRVAWFEFPQPGQPELVVFDTRSAEESARRALDIEPGSYALLASVTEQFAYWYDNPETVELIPLPLQRIELATGAQSSVTLQAYKADSPPPGTARTMMVGNVEGGGGPPYQVIDGTAWQFSVRAGRVEPQGAQPLDARDGATNRRFVFKAPAGYPNTLITWLMQWLDDDTVVLVAESDGGRDLLECRLSTGACVLALTLPENAVVPEIG